MLELRYSLIRYIPDSFRMEPINTGTIRQDANRIDFSWNDDLVSRPEIESDIFHAWYLFFEEEIRGEPVPFLQPPKSSPKFFDHLRSLGNDTVRISPTLTIRVEPVTPFEFILRRLPRQLVSIRL